MKPLAWLTSHKSTASIFRVEETRTWVNKLHGVLAQRTLFPNFTVYYTRKLLIAPPPHYSVFRHATGSQPLPNPFLHRERSSASFSNFKFPLFSLRSSSSSLFLLPRLPFTYIIPCYLSFANVL